MKIFLYLAFVLLLSACNLPAGLPLLATITPVSSTPTAGSSQVCAFVEGRQAIADISDKLGAKITATGLSLVSARAEAYGENCIAQDGSFVRFAARETDYYITLSVPETADDQELGTMLETLLGVIEGFPVESTPGPNPGYIAVAFQSSTNTRNLWFMRETAKQLFSEGVRGADLFRALAGNP